MWTIIQLYARKSCCWGGRQIQIDFKFEPKSNWVQCFSRDPFRRSLLSLLPRVPPAKSAFSEPLNLHQLSSSVSYFTLPCEATMEQHLFLLIILLSATSSATPNQKRGGHLEPSLRGLIPVRTQLSPDRESFINSMTELIAVKGVIVLRNSQSYAAVATSASSGSSTLPLNIASWFVFRLLASQWKLAIIIPVIWCKSDK